MGTTANGLPYPELDDPARDGATAIKNLATKADDALVFIGPVETEGTVGASTTAAGAATSNFVTGVYQTFFNAPPAGAVRITLACHLKNSAAGEEAAGQVGVFQDNGATLVGQLVTVCSNYGNQYVRSMGFCYAQGLTPGALYSVRVKVRSSGAGTATLVSPLVEVLPMAQAVSTTGGTVTT